MATFLDAHLLLLSQVASGAYMSPRCINLVFQVQIAGHRIDTERGDEKGLRLSTSKWPVPFLCTTFPMLSPH